MSKSELITSLQNEVRILLHLGGKIDRTKLDYRPTAKQRSTIELLKYLGQLGVSGCNSELRMGWIAPCTTPHRSGPVPP